MCNFLFSPLVTSFDKSIVEFIQAKAVTNNMCRFRYTLLTCYCAFSCAAMVRAEYAERFLYQRRRGLGGTACGYCCVGGRDHVDSEARRGARRTRRCRRATELRTLRLRLSQKLRMLLFCVHLRKRPGQDTGWGAGARLHGAQQRKVDEKSSGKDGHVHLFVRRRTRNMKNTYLVTL